MTEERKKYLAQISKEERVIRNQIDYHKSSLKMKKWLTKGNKDEDGISLLKSEIAEIKVIVKSLKKQLPAPTKSLINYHCNCPKCGFFVDGEEDNYCYNCGQKLR